MKKILLISFVLVTALASSAWSQGRNVTGKVTSDDDGSPLPGVNVTVRGTSSGTVTDVDGNYTLSVTGSDAVLVFSYVGYVNETVQVGNQSVINIALVPDVETLQEVVVTALGVEKEVKALGYSVEQVSGDDVARSNETNVLNAINGKVAGVQISDPNGVAGGTTRITIRGNNSLKQGKNQPLIIVDGVPIENSTAGPSSGTLNGVSGRDWGSGINNINAWDVESINVLKGPNAAALYGSRGANGVIIIKTKKAKAGTGLGIEFNTSQLTREAFMFRDVQNKFGTGGARLAEPTFDQDADGNNLLPSVGFWGSGASWGPEMDGTPVLWWDGETRPFSPQPDNIKDFFQTGSIRNYNLAFSGAGEMGSVRVSLTRSETTPIVPNTEREQNTINLNSSINVSSKLRADAAITYLNTSDLNSPFLGDSEASIGKNLTWNWGRSYRPDLERDNYKNPDGTRNNNGFPAWGFRGRGRTGSFFWNLFENNEVRERDRIFGSVALNYQILPWLSARGQLGIDNYDEDRESKNKPIDSEGIQGGRYWRTLAKNRVQNHRFTLTANKDVTEDINITASLGAEHFKQTFYRISGSNAGRDFANPWLYTFSNFQNPNGNINNSPSEDSFGKIINGVFGSVDVSYKNMLFLTLTGRNDWSSTLPDGVNSYFYPSASLSFAFTDAFDIAPDILSFGKVRVAYANVGNDTDPFEIAPTFNLGSYGGQPSTTLPGTIPPTALAPESVNSYEAGLDLRFLEGKIGLDFTYYYISSKDQILSSPLPISSGFNSLRFNTGELENRGVEFLIDATPFETKDFSWNIAFNYSSNKNKVVSLADGAETLVLGNIFGAHGPNVEARPGEEFGTIYGWDYTYFDTNGNGVTDDSERIPSNRIIDDNGRWYINTDEREAIGNVTPDWRGGVTNTLRYKQFTLSSLIDIKKGGDVFFGSYGTGVGFGQSPQTLEGRNAEHGGLPWTDGDGVTHNNGLIKEGVYANGETNDQVVSYVYKHLDLFTWGAGGIVTPAVHEASWVRLRELSLTYTLPNSLLDKIGFIQNASITLLGRNLWFLHNTAPDNLDPSAVNGSGNNQGIEWGQLPASRTYGFNLKLGL
ncbi:SusC/RagA family TonB-linked outer membrane protein [Fulvivirgaceae bacterium BMA10]|uniref:SusC/RagA family TonB-linked outer membrane protein n=1 Tax=Splendidivirga corallicola TaxID=3051826 RepID=A0ABT8KKQ3_9BACT|nr:SusC/RagA family TonB-linked outer membrane protein [Fulvivirgaceae bacterium BMA10]